MAANLYLQLRRDLAKIFTWNNCSDPEGLVDEVMERVGRKVSEIRITFEGDPKLYFYGVARYLIKETQKTPQHQVSLDDIDLPASEPPEPPDEPAEMRSECLQKCLHELSAEKSELILAYYAHEPENRIAARNELARRLGISGETLRVRAYRVRAILEVCVAGCLDRHR